MVGEKHTASKRARPEKEKTKGKGKATSSQPRQADDIPEERYYRRPSDFEKFLEVKDKNIGPLNCWDKKFLEKEKFDLFVDLDRLKLLKLVTFSDNVYPSLVKQFYANLQKEGAREHIELNTLIYGQQLSVTIRKLGEAFDMDYRIDINRAADLQDYSKAAAISFFWGDQQPKYSENKLQITGVGLENRLLHYALVKVIFPRKSNMQHVDDDTLFIMWCIRKGIPVNIPFFMLDHMVKNFRSASLPYGMVVTQLLRKEGVDVNRESTVLKFVTSKRIGEKHLHQMSFYKVEGQWQLVERGPAAVQAAPPEPAGHAAGLDMEALIARMTELHHETRALFDGRFDMLTAQVRDIGGRLESLEATVGQIAGRGHGQSSAEAGPAAPEGGGDDDMAD